jgi:hypothetical protein
MEYVEKTFTEVPQVVDGNRYLSCRFERCAMSYRGGEIPTIINCHFEDCTWHFEDAAERTLTYMQLLYHGMGENGRTMIERTVAAICSSGS